MSDSLQQQYGPWALIAGGSEGIGLEFARRLAAEGINLLLLARTEATLQAAAEQLREKFNVEVRTASVDLTADNLDQQVAELTDDLEIGMLIYNAGATHGADLFHDAPVSAAQTLVRLNCLGPVALCHRLGGAMRERGRGGIILLSSMSGLTGGAYIAAYTATKSFDIVFAEALWSELKPYGVNVLGLIAGATDTPAMARSGIELGDNAMSAADVAAEGLAALADGPLHVPGENNRAFAGMLRSEDRQQTSAIMSEATAGMYNRPWPLNT